MVDTPKVDFVRENGAIKVNEGGQPIVDFGGGRVEPFDLGRMLGQVGKLAEERDGFRTQSEEHARNLERFKGVDLTKYQKDQELLGKFNDGQLVAATEIQKQIDAAVGKKDTEIGELKTALEKLKIDSYQKTLLSNFANPRVQAMLSPAIQDPVDCAAILGRYFYEDSQGNLRAKDEKGSIVRSRRNPSEPADFAEAVEIILDTHPRGQSLRAAPSQTGAGSEKGDGGRGGNNGSEFTMRRSDAKSNFQAYKALTERAEKEGKTVTIVD